MLCALPNVAWLGVCVVLLRQSHIGSHTFQDMRFKCVLVPGAHMHTHATYVYTWFVWHSSPFSGIVDDSARWRWHFTHARTKSCSSQRSNAICFMYVWLWQHISVSLEKSQWSLCCSSNNVLHWMKTYLDRRPFRWAHPSSARRLKSFSFSMIAELEVVSPRRILHYIIYTYTYIVRTPFVRHIYSNMPHSSSY